MTAPNNDRGSISLYWAVAMASLLAVVGLVVDGGGAVQAVQAADQVAREAARIAGQQIQHSAAAGGTVGVNAAAGVKAADTFVASAGMTGSVVVDGSKVTVVVTGVYKPEFLSAIGATDIPVTGSASTSSDAVVAGKVQVTR